MQQLILPEFKIRCSAIGKIMTNPRTKGEGALSKTCISFLESWVNEQVYQRRVDFSSKQTAKGITVEDEAIIYASGFLNAGLISKNQFKFANEYMTGEPDLVTDDEVIDIKSSWSHSTFPLYARELPESDYEWQVTGYMALCEKAKGRVVYCLMSMPDAMIEREARWKLGYDYSQSQYDEFAEQFRYDNLGPELRLKEYAIEYDLEKVTAIEKRVLDCRAYIQSVILPELEKQKAKYFI
jgi:hypothetical protein